MQSEARFRPLFQIMLVVFLVIRVGPRLVLLRHHGEPRAEQGSVADARQRWTDIQSREGRGGLAARLLAALLLATLGPLYVFAPERVQHFAVPIPAWLRWIGVVLGYASLPALAWTHLTLGRAWSTNLELQEQHVLVTDGPYRWVRHPMYTSVAAFVLGSALVTANGSIILPASMTILVMLGRIENEEAMMVEHFGEAYREYMRHTGRLLPRFRT